MSHPPTSWCTTGPRSVNLEKRSLVIVIKPLQLMALSRIPRAGCVSTTAFFLCDIQTRFVSLISRMPTVVAAAATLVQAAEVTGRPLIVTEQYPKVFGNTVPELVELVGRCPSARILPKMQFSMMTPEVHAALPRDSYDRLAGNCALCSMVISLLIFACPFLYAAPSYSASRRTFASSKHASTSCAMASRSSS